jgi:hypothetical protein
MRCIKLKNVISLIISLVMLIMLVPVNSISVNSANSETVIWPVPGYNKITSRYGWRDLNGDGKNDDLHHAIDIGCPIGTNVLAVASGKVVLVQSDSYNRGMGLRIVIEHDNSIYTGYQHLSKINVKVGDSVSQGDVIALSGNSGGVPAHLDFHVKMNSGNDIDTVTNHFNKDPLDNFLPYEGNVSTNGETVYIKSKAYSFSNDPPSSNMSISGETKPEGNLQLGKFFAIKGNISSSLNIALVWGGVYYDDWTVTSQYAEATPNSTTYDLSTYFDNKIIFNRLEEGSYHYLIKAKDTDGNEYTLIESDFTIGTPKPLSSMSISGETKPEGNLQPGKFFAIKGNISSSLNIALVWGGVYYDDWTVTDQYAEAAPNSTSYDLSKYFDNKIVFNGLAEGSYHYLIKAKDTSGVEYTLVASDFNIGNPAKWYEKLPSATLWDSFDAIILNKNHWRPIRPDSSSNVVLHTEQGSIIEMWRFNRQSDGSYTIENYGNGLFLDAYGMGTDEGTNVCAHEGNDSAAQRWYIYEANDGYVFRPAYGELAMDLHSNKIDDNTNIQLWTYHGGDAQIFSIYTSGIRDYAKPKPNKITLTVKDHASIALSWEPSYYVEKYVVYRSTDDSNWKKLGETTTPNYTDTDLSAETKYYYKFEAQNRYYKESSASVSAKTNALPATTTKTVTTTITTTTTVKSTTTTVATSEKELELSEAEIYIKVGEKYTINSNQKDLTYASSDENIAIVSSKGAISGIKNGQAVITVINKSKDTASITVNVVSPKYGDANGDNDISIADAVIIMQSLANPDMYGLKGKDESHIKNIGYINADCYNTGDGITNADALAIQKYMLSLIASLPEKK